MNLADAYQTEAKGWQEIAAGFEARLTAAEQEAKQLREFMDWVDSFVSNPVGSYSTSALDGLFGMTRDKIAVLQRSHKGTAE